MIVWQGGLGTKFGIDWIGLDLVLGFAVGLFMSVRLLSLLESCLEIKADVHGFVESPSVLYFSRYRPN